MAKAAKVLFGVVSLAGLAALGWAVLGGMTFGFGDARDPAKPAVSKGGANPNLVRVNDASQKQLGLQFGKAIERAIVKRVDVPGVVAFDERRVTHLKPRTAGRVLTLSVQPGDKVEVGQVLATLDANSVLDAQNGLENAKASLNEAKAAHAAAIIAVKRAKSLLQIGGVAKAELERREVEEARAQAAVQSADARVDMYNAQYARLAPAKNAAPGTSEIVAPIEGVVVSANITLGEVIDTVKDAFTIADPSKVVVRASLFGLDINAVDRGDKATIESPLSQKYGIDAHVVSVNAALDPLTHAAAARLEVDNKTGALKANMFVSVRIEAALDRKGITIPAAAIQQVETGSIAFVRTAEDTFEKRALRLGLERPDWVEVLDGVALGETVVTEGSFNLKSLLVRNLLSAAE